MIGIFGGTFDPVHYGHLRSAWEVRERLRIRDFRLLPAGHPPHRDEPVTPARHRLEMLRLATRGIPGMHIDEREIERPGPSYMVDTLRTIRSESGEQPLLLIIGQDGAAALDTWHQWRELVKLAHLVIMRRPHSKPDYAPPVRTLLSEHWTQDASDLTSAKAGKVLNIETTQLAISSSGIRSLVREGRSPRFLLPDPVLEYIGSEGLYR